MTRGSVTVEWPHLTLEPLPEVQEPSAGYLRTSFMPTLCLLIWMPEEATMATWDSS